ncbi:ddx52 [Symbiodinium microadriaticum]|nr:ddx52 [Symbiodinium microadriaticum]
MRSAERQTPKNAKPCLQLLYCPSVGVAAPCSLKPSREAFHKSTDAPKDRCRIVLGSNVVDRRGKTSDADKGVRQARRAGRALQPLGRQSQSLAGRARPEVETYIAQAVWQKCESPRCVLKLFCGILGLKPKWHRCVRHGKCEEKTPTFKQKSVRGPADWMDFFDVLRKGCTFGGTKKSKEVAFGKRKAPDPAIRPSLSTRSSTVLDYFGLDHADTAAKDQAEPKEAKVAKGAKANGQGYKRPGSWPKGEAKEQEEALDKRALQQKQEAVAALRRRHRIHISPGTPDLVESFDDMASRGVPPWLVRNLTSLGFSQPTPIQMQCFPAIMSGSHVLASAPTGSGKTIAFLGPILALLAKPGKEFARALVVDPSRELAKQTLDEFAKLTSGRKWNGRLVDKLSDKSNIKRLDVAVATPLRLVQLLRDNRISLDSTKHLVFDEADKLLDLGFAPQVDELLTFCPKEKGRLMQTMMFSATLPPVVVDLAGSILTSPLRISIGDVNAAAPDVEQKLLFITSEDGKLFSFRQLLQDGEIKPPALVFVQSKERAKELFGELVYDGIFVDAIHADRTKLQRDNTVKAFRAGKLWVLICTDLMARGVDFKGVETVINYDFPQSAATYIHRIGRTGRAGRNGKAITMFTIEDFESLRSIVGVMRQSGCEVPEWMLRLKARSKKERRMAEWRQPKRKRISTVSGYDRKKSHKRQQMVDARASALVFRWTSEDFRTLWVSRVLSKASKKRKSGITKAHTGSSKFHQIVARTKKSKNRPHILRAKFAVPSELELDLNLELRFCCTACNRALTLTAHGKVHVSTLWQPFDVHLSFESGSRAPAAGSRGAAFARVILCPSMLCNPTAGLLTLEVLPQYPGGPGVTELLEASEVHDAAHAVHDKPAGLRLLLDTDGSPALMLDGRTQDPATRRQLCVEVSSKDAMQNVLLEMQALSGARRILVSVCLAALGPLGDVPVLVHHLHFGSRCSLALLASFEARRHQVELRDSEVLKPLSPPPMVDSKTFSGATDKEQKCHRLAEGLRRLPRPRAFVPSPARPQAEQIRRRRSNSVERVVSHPFLERGLHHWLAPSDPLVHKKPGHMWTQELGRKRPASAKATTRCGQAAARKPTGWDDASEARDGPKYRRDFLAQQHAKVWKLQEQLSRCHVEKERQEQRFGHVRRALAAAKQELNTRGHERKPGVRSSRNKDSRPKGEASTSLGPDRGPPLVAEQVCVVCGCLVPERSARYCAGCLPGTQREALDLRKSVGKSLATQASLQRRLEIQQEERAQLEVKHTDLEAKLYAAETGRPDSESEAAQQLMVLLTQLKTLKLDSEAQSRLDAERLEALQHREAVITAAHQEAQARYKKATRRHEDLQKQLDKGREKADMLLGKISSTAS